MHLSRREAWASAALVFIAAIAVRVWAAGVITFPRPEDTAYYVGVARNLVEGRGLVTDAIWSFGTPPLVFPRPAFEVWLPLPSFLAALPMALLAPTFAAAQWSSIVVGGLVAVLAWRLAADVAAERRLPVGRARTIALGTGLSAAVFMPLVLHSVLPNSTMLFGALVLAACLLGGQILRSPDLSSFPRAGLLARLGLTDRRVVLLGLLLGLAALTRNEAIWLALVWAFLAWRASGVPGVKRVALVLGAAIPAMVVFAPWAVRDWLVFGSPFPGQAIANALSLQGTDIFAWGETPTLSRYLGAGVAHLVGLRITGFFHNLVNVLLLLGIPISAIGLLALPWTMTNAPFGLATFRRRARPGTPAEPSPEPPPDLDTEPEARYVAVPLKPLIPTEETVAPPAPSEPETIAWGHQAERPLAYADRPQRTAQVIEPEARPGALQMLLLFSLLTFLATTLLFPVATTWGTFLHASAAVQVLLLLSALLALDRLIAEVGRRRGWTRPVAWLGPALGLAAGALFTLVLLPAFGRDGEGTRERFEALPAALAAAGVPVEIGGAPVITDFPIYMAEITGVRALALPNEPPDSIVDLAAHFPGTRLLIVASDNEGIWPEAALGDSRGLACFEEVPVDLEGITVLRILCP